MIRAAYIGNFKHPFCTEVHFARALRENGCQVGEIQQEEATERGPDATGQTIVDGGFDLVLYTRTHSASALGPEWTEAWTRLGDAGTVTASLHLDRFWDLEREHLIHDGDPLFTVDWCFTADGGNQDRFADAGVSHVWLPPAVDRLEATEMPARPPVRPLPYDVIFAGSDYGITAHASHYPERAELLAHLRQTYGRRFGHYGHGGTHPVVRQQDLNDLYGSAAVIVGDSCFANQPGSPRSAFYWSDRIPETLGRGGFLLHPWLPGLRADYAPDELATYSPGDWDDLDAQIGAYLANPGEREGFIERGRRRVLAEHTYTHRAATLLRTVGLLPEEES